MAFFKSRKGGDETAASPRQPESIEAMRKRAKHRLIGAAVLVLIGVIGFPLLFDTQPRPIAVDIPIEIPDRNKAKPLPAPAPAKAPAAQSSAPAPAPTTPALVASAAVKAETKPEPKAESRIEPKVEAKAESRPEPKPPTKPEAKAPPKAEPKAEARHGDGAKAQALLEGKPIASTAAAAEGRFIVQVGAFSDASKARETRLKVEKSGLKTYTHVAEGKDGKLIRVRVGPFGTKAEAEKAADKIKALDMKAAVLAL